jgi:hypothetical protein
MQLMDDKLQYAPLINTLTTMELNQLASKINPLNPEPRTLYPET